jgi:hypothetical protein
MDWLLPSGNEKLLKFLFYLFWDVSSYAGDNQLTASLTIPGVVFIQSLPFHKLSQRIARYDDVTHLLYSYMSLERI